MSDIAQSVTGLLKESEFIQFLNIELTELDDKHARGRMPFDAKYKNPYGSMHGGSLYSLADTVAGTLANMSGKAVTTIEGSLHFLAPAIDTEYIYCDARLKRGGAHLITVEVDITDDKGKLLDCGCYTFYRTETDLVPVTMNKM